MIHMARTKQYLLVILLICSAPLLLQAQQKHDALRKKYLAFTDEKYNEDSALVYAFKTKDAAIKEFGTHSMPYCRALNNVGYVYDLKSQNDSARIWWLQANEALNDIGTKNFLSLASAIYGNLKVAYLYHFINADSAQYFAYKYIDVNNKRFGDSSRSYLNLLCEVATDIEAGIGAGKAAPFYTLAQNTWEKQFGAASIAVIKGIDSLLSNNSITNNVSRRRELYKVSDTTYSVNKLEQLLTKSNHTYSSISYAAELLHKASKNKGEQSTEFIEALHKLSLAYYNSINERKIATYIIKKAITIAEQRSSSDKQYTQLLITQNDIEHPSSELIITQNIVSTNPTVNGNIAVNTTEIEPKLILPISHPQGITYAAFSSDEKYVVTKSYNDLNAKLWMVETGELIYNLSMAFGMGQPQFTKDNQYIITRNENNVDTWNIETGKKVATVSRGKTPFSDSFIPDSSSTFVIVDSSNNIQLWNAVTGQLISSAKCNLPITGYAYSKKIGAAIFYATNNKKESTVFEYHFASGATTLILKNQKIREDVFSDNEFVTFIGDKAFVFDRHTFTIAHIFSIREDSITSSSLTPMGDKLLICYNNKIVEAYKTADGDLISSAEYNSNIEKVLFINSGKNFVQRTSYWAAVRNTDKQNILYFLDGDTLSRLSRNVEGFVRMSKDQKQIMMVFPDNVLRIWNINDSSATLKQSFKGETTALNTSGFDARGKQILVGTTDGILKLIDPFIGKIELSFTDSIDFSILLPKFSKDDKLALLYPQRNAGICVFNIASGKIVQRLNQAGFTLHSANFSDDAKLIVTATTDEKTGMITVWDWLSGKVVKRFPVTMPNDVCFDSTGKKLLITHQDSTISIYNLVTNKREAKIYTGDWAVYSKYVLNRQYIINVAMNRITLINAGTLKVIRSFTNDNNTGTCNAVLTKDAKRILMSSRRGVLTIVDVASGKTIQSIEAHTSGFEPILTEDNKLLITVSEDGTIKVWDFALMKFLYQIIPLSGKDYIIVDAFNRYDGTEAARKQLYFTCGTEVIGLDQVKDQLWVPRLAERLLKGEKIDAPSLTDLNICGLTPLVKAVSGNTDSSYRFTIIPRRGGLAETVLFVNDIEAKRYQPAELAKVSDGYELEVTANSIKDLFIAGKDNKVTVKAYTAEKGISSRGVGYKHREPLKANAEAPDVYAVMVGVSDYKGEKLDLHYAAKDAIDLSKAVSASARKLLNTNGTEHVFVYNLTAEKNQAINATKKSIKEAFADIAGKAKANDILLIFFAGHGVMEGEKKQFFFLTADASDASIGSSSIADVGISTAELSEWMQPQRIKAQKRVLIFDACNSGQAITELVAVRDDKAEQQVKAIEKLNEKSGLFILSASASNQSAYEMGVYSQGLLTYTLLKAMKEQPDILDDSKYLNVSKWFNAAEKNVDEIVKETGNRQQPQIVSTTNFNIGIVDQDVMTNIILPKAKPLFAASNFQNSDEAIAEDNLELTKLVNANLKELGGRGLKSTIRYDASNNSLDACSLSGRYEVKGDAITVKVNIKYDKTSRQRFEVVGKKDKLEDLAASIAEKAAAFIDVKKQ